MAKEKKRMKKNTENILTQVLLIVMAALFLFPFVWMICTSLKTETGIADYKQLLPWPVSFRSFVKGWKGGKFLVYIWNTVRVAGLCVVGTVCSCSLVAFGFAKFQSKAKNVLFLVLLATMMVPQTVTLIPMYIMYSRFHWLNTIYPLVLPAFFGTSTFNIFLLRQFFAGLPNDLAEAAKIDGCSWFGIFSRIYLPNCKPALLVVVINQLVFCWNDYMAPLIYLGRPAKFTIALGLNAFKGEAGSTMDIGPIMAMAVVTILPLLVLYLCFQKYFVEGVAASGIKG